MTDLMKDLKQMALHVETVMRELIIAGGIKAGQIVVIGTSTSEVIGKHIGTSGNQEAAQQIFAGIEKLRQEIGFYTAFQCCEHLNRALVVERDLLDRYPLDEVAAVPIAKAGGSMASYAYRHMANPCLVETVKAHAGIDIGETLIGMHLLKVAVPFRPSIRQIGHARINMAFTRPKLIGGARAVYILEADHSSGLSAGKTDHCE